MNKFLIFFLFFNSFAFTQTLEGIVKDEISGVPLSGVHISSSELITNTYSDTEGRFSITTKPTISLRDSIFFSTVGYRSEKFSFGELKAVNFEVLLTPVTEELREVNVNSGRALKPSIKFSTLPEMESGVYDFGSVVAGDKIFVIAGDASFIEDPIREEQERKMGMISFEDLQKASQRNFTMETFSDKIQVYDLKQNEWTVHPIPVRRRAGHSAVVEGNKVYIMGGKNRQLAGKKEFLDDKIEIFDLEKDSLVLDHVNPHQAIDATAFVYKGNIMVLGGSLRINRIGNKVFTDAVHLLNLQSGLWFEAGKMTVGKETVGVRVNDEFYLIGGNDGRNVKKIEVLNLKTGLWDERLRLPQAFKNPAVTAHAGTIYIYEKGNFSTYDTQTGELQNFDIDLKVEGPGLHYANGKLYLFGGYIENVYSRSPESHCYSIDLNEFNTTAFSNVAQQ